MTPHLTNVSPYQLAGLSKAFNVRLQHNAKGGSRGSGWFCTYLYPKASGTAWAFKAPEAKNSHRITFT